MGEFEFSDSGESPYDKADMNLLLILADCATNPALLLFSPARFKGETVSFSLPSEYGVLIAPVRIDTSILDIL